MGGKKLCVNWFCAIVHLSPQRINRRARYIASNLFISSYQTDRDKGRTGKTSFQTKIAVGFLKRYAELHGFPCPRGRLYNDSESVRYSPSGISRKTAYAQYTAGWEILRDGAAEIESTAELPKKELVYDNFTRVWRQNHPNLKLSKGGTDFCDTCVSKTRKLQLLMVVQSWKKLLLKKGIGMWQAKSTYVGKNVLFGLPEGHWKGGENADEVLSMLYYCLKYI